jgi:metal-responsive CopG/Arc/MetJ family transcriptional regulator
MALVSRISVSIEKKILYEVVKLVEKNIFANRSQAIQTALEKNIMKKNKIRLARESAKLKQTEEQTIAEEGLN